MSLYLTKEEIYEKLKNRILIKSKKELLNYLNFTKNNFLKYTKNIDNQFGIEKYINPTLWQMGHVIFFYVNLVLKNLDNCQNINISNLEKYIEFYDSHKTKLEDRKGKYLLNYDLCFKYYNEIYLIIEDYIKCNNIRNIETYLILLGILHNEMHNEAFIFTKLSINNELDIKILTYNYESKLIKDIEFIDYGKGTFIQGNNDNKDFLIFDNEKPEFTYQINSFKISKYPITEYQYLIFILKGGYTNDTYWSSNGLNWRNKNNIRMPLYWLYKNQKYLKKIGNKEYDVNTNLPIVNISYYEAEAYCNFIGGRLPYESEYEYVATNKGKTLFPWGNDLNFNKKCNLNYKNYICPVNEYQTGNNFKGIGQLIGNIWEWCEEPIYPYDGFTIDPVYREMSYPFFGFKKICKGGCFCVSDFLIHPKYRNAQYPDCRIQFIGFRVCI